MPKAKKKTKLKNGLAMMAIEGITTEIDARSIEKHRDQKAFFSNDVAKMQLAFPNGTIISTIWIPGSYSDNHFNFDDITAVDYLRRKGMGAIAYQSNTVEVMLIRCPVRVKSALVVNRFYTSEDAIGDPIGELTLQDWLKLINFIASIE